MPKRKSVAKSSDSLDLTHYKHHIIPSTVGGVAAYLLSGVAILGLGVFASVWVGNMISRHLHKN